MGWTMEQVKVPEGSTVLDPFMGSGSTAIACLRTGRPFIGVERDPGHFNTAVERIRQELAQGDLFLGQNATHQARRDSGVALDAVVGQSGLED